MGVYRSVANAVRKYKMLESLAGLTLILSPVGLGGEARAFMIFGGSDSGGNYSPNDQTSNTTSVPLQETELKLTVNTDPDRELVEPYKTVRTKKAERQERINNYRENKVKPAMSALAQRDADFLLVTEEYLTELAQHVQDMATLDKAEVNEFNRQTQALLRLVKSVQNTNSQDSGLGHDVDEVENMLESALTNIRNYRTSLGLPEHNHADDDAQNGSKPADSNHDAQSTKDSNSDNGQNKQPADGSGSNTDNGNHNDNNQGGGH